MCLLGPLTKGEFDTFKGVIENKFEKLTDIISRQNDQIDSISTMTSSLKDTLHIQANHMNQTSEAEGQLNQQHAHAADTDLTDSSNHSLPFGGIFNEVSTQQDAPSPISLYATGKLDIQSYAASLKDSLTKHMLPSDLRVSGLAQTFSKEDAPSAKILRKCRDYTETTIKYLSTLSADNITTKEIEDVLLLQIAQLKYLQDETAYITVKSKQEKDNSPAEWFRFLQSATCPLSNSQVQHVRPAGDLTTAISNSKKKPQFNQIQGNNFRNQGSYGN